MKKEIRTNPVYQKAFMVKDWGDTIYKGHAFIFTYNDGWSETTKAFFIKAGETIPLLVDAKQVVFTKEHADSLLKREMDGLKNYYERQLKDAQTKLDSFNPHTT